ncbi:MAG TPA: hypothetical protein PLC98_17595 [Anaerolineales bacterium]|nr:hypothetical protein [Anaerolineales bacterium]
MPTKPATKIAKPTKARPTRSPVKATAAKAGKPAPKAVAPKAAPPKAAASKGEAGTREAPWKLTTANGGSEYVMFRDETLDPPALVCKVGSTELRYHLRCIEDLHAMLKKHGDWMPLGAADEQKPAAEGTVEAWGRSTKNPVGGWYGLRKGYRGRFGMYVPPLLEKLGLVELEHNPKNNRVRAR